MSRPKVPRCTEPKERVRLSSEVDANGCWVWLLAKFRSGHAMIRADNYTQTACRYSYAAFVGTIPEGHIVSQSCGRKDCVNPDHLICGPRPEVTVAIAGLGHGSLPVNDAKSVMENVYPEPNSGCWLWGGKLARTGYGVVNVGGKRWLVHRFIKTVEHGPIPDGLQIDHLCRNRACCNPDHLEAVTPLENFTRGVVTKNIGGICRHHGIKMKPYKSGPQCRACQLGYQQAWRARKKEERAHEQR